MEKKHSFFMKDENNSDRIEGLVDAFLSWTLQWKNANLQATEPTLWIKYLI